MHYYKFDISTWNMATSHLSLEEEAVYFRLLNYYYHTESNIPLETQSVLRKLRLGSHAQLVDSILNEFFIKTKDGWIHEYCDIVIASFHEMSDKNRKNGILGGRPRKPDAEKNPLGSQSEPTRNPNETLIINNELEIRNNKSEIRNKYIPPIPKELLSDYLQVRKAKKVGPLTETAFKAIEKEAKKAGITIEDAITICISRGWVGFKAEWIESKSKEFKTAFQRRQENNDKAFNEFLNGGIVEKEVKDVGF